MKLFIFGGGFSSWRAFISTCIIILDGYLHSHPSGLYITCFVIFPLHFPLLSIPCFILFFCPALFIISRSLYFSFLCVAMSWLSHALQAWWYPNPRGNYWKNISGYQRLTLAMLLPNFYNWSFWSHEWKMTILKALTDETGWWELFTSNYKPRANTEGKCWSTVDLPAPVIKSFNPESTPSGKKTPRILFSVFIWSETVW